MIISQRTLSFSIAFFWRDFTRAINFSSFVKRIFFLLELATDRNALKSLSRISMAHLQNNSWTTLTTRQDCLTPTPSFLGAGISRPTYPRYSRSNPRLHSLGTARDPCPSQTSSHTAPSPFPTRYQKPPR